MRPLIVPTLSSLSLFVRLSLFFFFQTARATPQCAIGARSGGRGRGRAARRRRTAVQADVRRRFRSFASPHSCPCSFTLSPRVCPSHHARPQFPDLYHGICSSIVPSPFSSRFLFHFFHFFSLSAPAGVCLRQGLRAVENSEAAGCRSIHWPQRWWSLVSSVNADCA